MPEVPQPDSDQICAEVTERLQWGQAVLDSVRDEILFAVHSMYQANEKEYAKVYRPIIKAVEKQVKDGRRTLDELRSEITTNVRSLVATNGVTLSNIIDLLEETGGSTWNANPTQGAIVPQGIPGVATVGADALALWLERASEGGIRGSGEAADRPVGYGPTSQAPPLDQAGRTSFVLKPEPEMVDETGTPLQKPPVRPSPTRPEPLTPGKDFPTFSPPPSTPPAANSQCPPEMQCWSDLLSKVADTIADAIAAGKGPPPAPTEKGIAVYPIPGPWTFNNPPPFGTPGFPPSGQWFPNDPDDPTGNGVWGSLTPPATPIEGPPGQEPIPPGKLIEPPPEPPVFYLPEPIAPPSDDGAKEGKHPPTKAQPLPDAMVPDWGGKDTCENLLRFQGWGFHKANTLAQSLGWFRTADGEGNAVITYPSDFLTGLHRFVCALPIPYSCSFAELLHAGVEAVLNLAGNAWAGSIRNVECDKVTATTQSVRRMILHILNGILSGMFDKPIKSVRQFEDFNCPQGIPSQSELDNALMMGTMDVHEWECYTKANDNPLTTARKVLKSKKVKPGVAETLSLWLRRAISADEMVKRMRALGVVDDTDLRSFIKLTEFIPPYTDLVRMMVRDVEDDKIVSSEQLDRYFHEKFKGTLKEWAEAQGISEDAMLYIWRAHWDYPSFTQGLEMYHRLRPGVVDKDIEVTKDDLRRLLTINDMSPWWVDRMIAISFHPITRIDIVRGYRAGSYGKQLGTGGFVEDEGGGFTAIGQAEKRMTELFQSVHYNLEDAHLLAYIFAREWENSRKSKGRIQVKSAVCGLLQEGLIDSDAAVGQMTNAGILEDEAKLAVEICEIKWRAKAASAYRQSVLGSFKRGEISQGQATNMLIGAGVSRSAADQFVRGVIPSRSNRQKALQASQLCKFRKQHLIDSGQMLSELLALGYPPNRASLIVRSCEVESEASAEKVRQRYREKNLRDATAAIRKASIQGKQAKLERCGKYTEAMLRRLFIRGVLDHAEVKTVLVDCKGHNDRSAELWIADAWARRNGRKKV